MRLLAIAILATITLGTISYSQDNASSSVPPATATDSKGRVPPATDPDAMPAFKVCSEKNPPPCVTPPRPVYSPEADYSIEAKNEKIQGTVGLWAIVGVDGKTHNIMVKFSVGHGLDEEAIKAVRKWKFKPATVDGRPVPVKIDVQVEFRLHR